MKPIRELSVLAVAMFALFGCEQPKYDPRANAESAFQSALADASEAKKYLMVVFGADWCPDCQQLYDNLNSPDVHAYMNDHMDFLTVDVGDKDRNIAFASSLGVSIDNGIPVAVFFDPSGQAIATTNDGQLEPSRYLTSRQILRFVKAVVDERRITRPEPTKNENSEET